MSDLNYDSTQENSSNRQQIKVCSVPPEIILEDKLKVYVFPFCTKGIDHTTHQLNKFCLDPRCRKDQVLEPLCIICEEYKAHSTPNHHTKSLKMVLRDLIYQSRQLNQKIEENEDQIENSLIKIGQEYKSLSDRCLKLSDDCYNSLEIYRNTMLKESPKKAEVRRVLETLLNNQSEYQLRNNLKKLVNLTVIEKGSVRINDDISNSIKVAVENNAEKYIQIMRDSIKRLTSLVDSLLEISILEGYEQVNEQIQVGDEFDYLDADAHTKTGLEQKRQRLEQQKIIQSEKEAKLYQNMLAHTQKCQNKYCQEVVDEMGVGSWRISDCYWARKMSEEWQRILQTKNLII